MCPSSLLCCFVIFCVLVLVRDVVFVYFVVFIGISCFVVFEKRTDKQEHVVSRQLTCQFPKLAPRALSILLSINIHQPKTHKNHQPPAPAESCLLIFLCSSKSSFSPASPAVAAEAGLWASVTSSSWQFGGNIMLLRNRNMTEQQSVI